jgi:hypothetical protein
MSFLSHRHTEFALVSDLERLRTLAESLHLDGLSDEIERARSNITNHRFSIAVVGEFKRGKSTFINALLGKEILPSDVAPTSATINRVTYGLKPSVRILFRSGLEEAIGVGQLANYVTKLTPEAEAMAATIREAVVEYPVPFCKQNVDIIDTPGLSDDPAMTAVTLDVLKRVDAAILVILATAPFSQSEAAFLEKLLLEYGLGSVVFVVTAMDRLRRHSDRQTVLETVTARIEESIRQHGGHRFGDGTPACEEYRQRVGRPRVFGVSGYHALSGKLDGDEALLSESRFPEFEAFLERFLTEESGLVALRTHAERLAGFADALRRDAAAGLESRAQTVDPAVQESLEAFLRAIEWLGQDARSRLDQQRRETVSEMQALLQPLPRELVEAAEACYVNLSVTADDLESPRLEAFVATWGQTLTDAVRAACAVKAPALVAELRTRLTSALEGLLRFATTCDHAIAHVRVPPGTAEAGRTLPSVERSFFERLGGTSGFDRSAAVESAAALLFNTHGDEWQTAIAASLVPAESWATGVEVQPMAPTGPKFTRRVVDWGRIEKFKMDLRGRLTEALTQHLQRMATAREQGLARQVAQAFATLERQVDEALDDVRLQRSTLQADVQRRIALHDSERRRLEELDSEIRAIHDRAKESARQLAALELGGAG